MMEEKTVLQPSEVLPAVALRGMVMFPTTTLHFDCARDISIAAINEAMNRDRRVYLASQKDPAIDDPKADDLWNVGVVAKIKQVLKLKGGILRVSVEGAYRAKTVEILQENPYYQMVVSKFPEQSTEKDDPKYLEAVLRTVKEQLEEYCFFAPQVSRDLVLNAMTSDDPQKLSEYVANNIAFEPEEKQNLLMESNMILRLEYLAKLLVHEVEILKLEKDIAERVKEQMDKNQKEYYLREQIKAINIELGESEDGEDDADKYQKKLDALQVSEEVKKKLQDEINKLRRTPYGSQEGLVCSNYLELALNLPWNEQTEEKLDVNEAEKVLEEDHYGMKKVKERILESLAVRKLAPDIKGQILCLVGPPGVGKTSIAKSIAKACGRKYVRMSLGGVKDEAEIRGHRKTYIGAMPGRIINAVKQSGVNNPLILLDEVDKLSSDYKGDPSSALLEVLDAEQNFSFRDHYLEVPFDLSNVMFLATANDAGSIPGPLYDRMEVITLSSYTREEKFHIAKDHLLPKQMKRHGLNGKTARVSDDALYGLIDGYTREAGVRTLEREIGSVCRKCAKEIVAGEKKSCRVSEKNLEALLGPKKFKDDDLNRENLVGVVNGLAWTAVGGELLQVEVAVVEGSGKIELTGSLGDVMKESAKAAVTYVRSVCDKYNIEKDFYKTKDIHIHFPEGAVPKDGPSAGITITTALVSALSGMEVRHDVAMTGEVTLRGRVLPIGGLKEKTMAAYRNKMKTVIIPQNNKVDLHEVDPIVKENIRFVTASQVSQVLDEALIWPVKNEVLAQPEQQEPQTLPEMPKPKGRASKQPIMEKV